MPTARSLAEHLDPRIGPKRVLTLDGGGLRGFLSLGLLARLEAQLRERRGGDPQFRLADHFDLIAGTSTGAIIAAALSLGMSVDEVLGHYDRLGETVFKSHPLRRGVLRAKYPAERVRDALRSVFGERRLDSPDFRTGLLVLTKRLDTGSVWPLSNHPGARYFRRGTGAQTIANGEYPLWQVVRASTAAPSFFEPETITIGAAGAGQAAITGEFVDGGVSPHNNPALQALMSVTMPGYPFGWTPGAERLLVVSIGTGQANAEVGASTGLQQLAVAHAGRALMGLMEDCADQVEALMQWLSVSPTARVIDREMGDGGGPVGGHALCTFVRYNVRFRPDWWAEHLGETATAAQLEALSAMDDPDQIPELKRVGLMAGARLIRPEHLPAAFDPR